jgi:indolepyruvate ferredoxin oxidoreductase
VTGHLKKSEYGAWLVPVFGVLAKLKFLRGGALDVFGRTAERRMERQLIGDYRNTLREVLGALTPANHDVAVEIADVPELIKGFGHVKERNAEIARQKRDELLAAYRAVPADRARTGS